MTFPGRRDYGYQPPGRDSARAKANATLFLIGARDLDNVTAERLAQQHWLKLPTAEQMLLKEKERRRCCLK